jgi:hypothetical protein
MATRDRTALFVQYRNSFGRSHSKTAHAGLMSLETDRVGLLGDGSVSSSALPSQHAIEMSRLPPRWCVDYTLILLMIFFLMLCFM